MRITKSAWSAVAQVVYVAAVAIGMSFAIGAVTQAGILLWASVPAGLVLVAAMMWLPSKPQLLGWAGVSIWLLATTYLGTSDIEYIALFVVVLLTAAGLFWSPWFLVGVWVFHPLWDLIPRSLPDAIHDLPVACLTYDLIVAAYLAWRTYKGFFSAVGIQGRQNATPRVGLGNTAIALFAIAVVLVQILLTYELGMDSRYAPVFALLIAALVTLGVSWLPRSPQLAFWTVLTAWTGMTFAHSGDPLEVLIFFGIFALAIFGFMVSPMYLVIAWVFHAIWSLAPHSLNHSAAMLMGHWMEPSAAVVYELSIATYLVLAQRWGLLRNSE
jgi:hypothetical protein